MVIKQNHSAQTTNGSIAQNTTTESIIQQLISRTHPKILHNPQCMPEFITLVTQAMQHTQQINPYDCKWPAQGITDHQEYEPPMNNDESSNKLAHV